MATGGFKAVIHSFINMLKKTIKIDTDSRNYKGDNSNGELPTRVEIPKKKKNFHPEPKHDYETIAFFGSQESNIIEDKIKPNNSFSTTETYNLPISDQEKVRKSNIFREKAEAKKKGLFINFEGDYNEVDIRNRILEELKKVFAPILKKRTDGPQTPPRLNITPTFSISSAAFEETFKDIDDDLVSDRDISNYLICGRLYEWFLTSNLNRPPLSFKLSFVIINDETDERNEVNVIGSMVVRNEYDIDPQKQDQRPNKSIVHWCPFLLKNIIVGNDYKAVEKQQGDVLEDKQYVQVEKLQKGNLDPSNEEYGWRAGKLFVHIKLSSTSNEIECKFIGYPPNQAQSVLYKSDNKVHSIPPGDVYDTENDFVTIPSETILKIGGNYEKPIYSIEFNYQSIGLGENHSEK